MKIMKQRLSDEEFIENARKDLIPIIGKFVKITVRVSNKTDLRSYYGTLESVDGQNFTIKRNVNENGIKKSEESVTYHLIDLHFFYTPYDDGGKFVFLRRYRKN